jgi:hypothetical protein
MDPSPLNDATENSVVVESLQTPCTSFKISQKRIRNAPRYPQKKEDHGKPLKGRPKVGSPIIALGESSLINC